MRILVTGASGYIGSNLSHYLVQLGFDVVTCGRDLSTLPESTEKHEISEISSKTNWRAALQNVDIVVHCAARVPSAKKSQNQPSYFQSVNVDGTRSLAQQASELGIKKFIFLSSIKVNGEQTAPGQPFTEESCANPSDPYGQSKWDAELALKEVCDHSSLNYVIIRPPMVYGMNVKGNMHTLMRIAKLRIPLPFGAIDNKRSLIGVQNLVDFICHLMLHDETGGQLYLVSDGKALSTTDIFREIYRALRLKGLLIPVSHRVLEKCLGVIGAHGVVEKLLGSLEVESLYVDRLGWRAPLSMENCINGCQLGTASMRGVDLNFKITAAH